MGKLETLSFFYGDFQMSLQLTTPKRYVMPRGDFLVILGFLLVAIALGAIFFTFWGGPGTTFDELAMMSAFP
jgi:hypothetical protein